MSKEIKKVLISGISGQDGSYMSEYCLNLGHKVIGVVRRTSTLNTDNWGHLKSNPNFEYKFADLNDASSLDSLVQEVNPDYFINFAAQSFVGVSWKIPYETFMTGAVGVLNCLESIRKYAPNCRFYNAGSSEQFGDVAYSPQDEKHPFRPRSPYGAAKASAHHLVKVYRDSYNLYAVQGLLFNHESERRGEEFVTRKITKGVARIKHAIDNNLSFEPIELGNLDAKRDWSHAEDFIDGVWKMLNQEEYRNDMRASGHNGGSAEQSFYNELNRKEYSNNLREYVLSSNETHTIREFVELAFKHAGINGVWVGDSLDNKFFSIKPYPIPVVHKCLVSINPEFYRPAEVDLLLGDSSLARKELGWSPKVSFEKLVERMVSWDLKNS